MNEKPCQLAGNKSFIVLFFDLIFPSTLLYIINPLTRSLTAVLLCHHLLFMAPQARVAPSEPGRYMSAYYMCVYKPPSLRRQQISTLPHYQFYRGRLGAFSPVPLIHLLDEVNLLKTRSVLLVFAGKFGRV